MLSDAELALMRTEADKWLVNTCNILAGTISMDAYAGGTTVYGTIAVGVPCFASSLPTRDASDDFGEQFEVRADWAILLQYDETIESGHRIELSGTTFHVVTVDDVHTFALMKRCHVRKVS